MLLNKTERARAALQAGPAGGLGLQDRRILIVTDGKRTLNEVMQLLGPGILPAIDRLIREGYIDDGRTQAPAIAAPAAPGMGSAFTGMLRAATDAVQARTGQIRARAPHAQAATTVAPAATPDATVAAAPPPASGGQRRSLVAAKMYIVDMLQLQRHPDAVELKTRIQTTSGQAELLDAILGGMRVLVQLASESYGQRVVSRLGEVLPEQCLPALERAVASLRAPSAGAPQLKLVGG